MWRKRYRRRSPIYCDVKRDASTLGISDHRRSTLSSRWDYDPSTKWTNLKSHRNRCSVYPGVASPNDCSSYVEFEVSEERSNFRERSYDFYWDPNSPNEVTDETVDLSTEERYRYQAANLDERRFSNVPPVGPFLWNTRRRPIVWGSSIFGQDSSSATSFDPIYFQGRFSPRRRSTFPRTVRKRTGEECRFDARAPLN